MLDKDIKMNEWWHIEQHSKIHECPNGCGLLKPVLRVFVLKDIDAGNPQYREWVLKCSVCGEEFSEYALSLYGEYIPPRLKAKISPAGAIGLLLVGG